MGEGGGVEILPSALSEAALRGLVEEFVTRDGTDYGERERSLDEKVAAVMDQIERGEVRVWFDSESETATLRTSDD